MAQADTQPDPPFRGRATIRDIADLAGVSIATVSRVLNDRPDVSPETRETVLQVVREHGFQTNRGARGLSSGRTGMIGLTLPLVADAYFGPILSGAAEALYERDLRIVLAATLHEHDREVSLVERLMGGTTDGAILMLPEESEAELLSLQRQGFPFVVVDPREPPPEGIPCVAAMHASGAKQATEHLLSLGHRRIGVIAGPPGWYATEERLAGFRAALAGAGMLLDADLVVHSDWRLPWGTAAAHRLLELPEPPTAIFGFNDNVAIGALHAAHERGLQTLVRLPDVRRAQVMRWVSQAHRELAHGGVGEAPFRKRLAVENLKRQQFVLVRLDETHQAVIVTPRLTSVSQPLAEMGRMGVSLLLRLLEGQRLDALRVELATRLVVRDSTAPPRS